MARIRIVTDASAYLRPELIARYKIGVLPLEVRYGAERFAIVPGEDRQRTALFRRMANGPAMPAEAVFAAATFEETFARLSRDVDEILLILNSGKLSNGIARAQAAARAYLGRCRITIVDSLSTSWGLGLVAEASAKAADEGVSLDGIIRLIRGLLPHIYSIFFVERLDYLEQKGKIRASQALLGTMLRIKPMLLVEDGDILPMEKVRTRALAVEKLADFVGEFAAVEKVVILRSPLENGMEESVAELRRLLGAVLPRRHFPVIEYDAVLACHLGPQALGVIVYERG
jgi:DegV family protein with EDD domain